LGEADRLLTVITPSYGKLTIKAAGVRKITSRRAAHTELLNRTILSLYKGAGMHVLTEANMLDDFSEIKLDFTKVGIAYHLCELVDGLCPENQENSKVFYLLKNTLLQLSNQEVPVQTPAKYFRHEDIDDYTLGTYGISVSDATPKQTEQRAMHSPHTVHEFEIAILSALGYWDKDDDLSKNFDTHTMIENILERKLKSRSMFSKLQ
jgi:hypothetical protein